jgi:hypothetical protein
MGCFTQTQMLRMIRNMKKVITVPFYILLALTELANDCLCFQPVAMKHKLDSRLWSKMQSDKSYEAVLNFSASLHYCTPPIQLTINDEQGEDIHETVSSFFENDNNALYVLVGSGNMESRIIKETPVHRYESEWETEAVYYKGDDIECPTIHEKTRLVELRTETPFLVFTICAMALLGKHMVHRQSCSSGNTELPLPELQFVLLKEDFEAAGGPPPLVWIFNQLTGKGKNPAPFLTSIKDDDRHHNVHSFLKVYPVFQRSSHKEGDKQEKANRKTKDAVAFHAICKAEIKIAFPSLLLHILPVAKEVIEHQGQIALKKSMERDLIPGMNNFARQFRKAMNRKV